ncbi:MAG: DUF6314 family protein [Pseudomonadota bacterium]|nr:DUF6314 family protein [Pseudomonadota bacterium]
MQQTRQRIQQLWQRLQTTAAFSYTATPGPGSRTGWQGWGQGQVTVERVSATELHFIEQGSFTLHNGPAVEMHNRFIWQQSRGGVTLSHGRRGEPVFLFELIPAGDALWRSAQDHVCIDDLYSGNLTENANGFELIWHIHGPKKNEQLVYRYSPDIS